MSRRTAERGEGNLGCILWLLVLAVAVMIAWKAIPVKVNSAELYDYMEELARFGSSRGTSEGIAAKIVARAQELDLPVKKENVTVRLSRDRVRMAVDYTVPLEFPGYTYQWHFHHELDRPIFIV